MERKVYHVSPDRRVGSLQWKVSREKAQRANGVFENKNEAIAFARARALKMALSQIKIHNKHGVIQKEYTYGKDPKRYKG